MKYRFREGCNLWKGGRYKKKSGYISPGNMEGDCAYELLLGKPRGKNEECENRARRAYLIDAAEGKRLSHHTKVSK